MQEQLERERERVSCLLNLVFVLFAVEISTVEVVALVVEVEGVVMVVIVIVDVISEKPASLTNLLASYKHICIKFQSSVHK